MSGPQSQAEPGEREKGSPVSNTRGGGIPSDIRGRVVSHQDHGKGGAGLPCRGGGGERENQQQKTHIMLHVQGLGEYCKVATPLLKARS